ncbi:MAG: CARDB domain-containing protein [Draconibacterium sp.]
MPNLLAGNSSIEHSFSALADLSVKGLHTIKAYVSAAGDIDLSNDSAQVTIENRIDSTTQITSDVSICRGDYAFLEASGGVFYLWSTGSTAASIQVNPTQTTIYSVQIITDEGCEVEKSVQVTVFEDDVVPVISSTPIDSSCIGGMELSTQLAIPVMWKFEKDGDIFDLGESLSISVQENGLYYASYTNENGCESKSQAFQFEEVQFPEIELSGYATVCSGESIVLSISGASQVLWSTGKSTESIVVTPNQDSTFSVSGSLANGCVFSDSVLVSVIPAQAPDPVSQMLPADASVNLTQPISLSWQPGENTVAFDLYVWEDGQSKTQTPFASDIQAIGYSLHSLSPGQSYLWQVVAKNSCFSIEGPVQQFTAAGIPDLILDSLDAPVSVLAGNSITLTWEVKNVGNGSTNNKTWEDYVYLSADLDLRRGDDLLLGSFNNIASLLPGESYVVTKELDIPLTLKGTYYLFVSTDNDDGYCRIIDGVCSDDRKSHRQNVLESDEQNNYIFSTLSIMVPPLPDLTVNSLGVIADAFSGDTINVTYEVLNDGDIAARGLLWRIKDLVGAGYSSGGSGGGVSNSSSSGSYTSEPLTESCQVQYYWKDAVYLSNQSEFSFSTATKLDDFSVLLSEWDSTTSCFDESTLQVGNTYIRNWEVELPNNIFGTYYIYIIPNYYGLFEDDYSNNIYRSTPINVRLTPPADLAVTALTAPGNAIAGQKVDISWTVQNNGLNPPLVDSWIDEVFISESPDFDKNTATSLLQKTYKYPTVYFEGYPEIDKLENGDSYTQDAVITIPERIQGDYYLFVLNDTKDKVFEFQTEDDNLRRTDLPLSVSYGNRPDLAPVSISVPDSIYRGERFPIKWKTINQGLKGAAGYYDHLYWAAYSEWTPGKMNRIGNVIQKDSLRPGQSIEKSALVELPLNTPDSVWFFVVNDYTDKVFETDETNNTFGRNEYSKVYSREVIHEIEYVDLEAVALNPATLTPGSGDLIDVLFAVQNNASYDVQKTIVSRIYLTLDSVLTSDDYYLEQHAQYKLAAGESFTATKSVKIPELVSGECYMYLWVDYTNRIAEDTIKANNILLQKINVSETPAPDLLITSMSAPSEVWSGQDFYVKYTLQNIGVGPTRNTWYDAFSFHTSPLPEGNQSAGFSTNTFVLNPGDVITDSVLLTVPSGYEGNYYLVGSADKNNNLFEGLSGGEDNNHRNQLILVKVPDPADLTVASILLRDSVYLGDKTTTTLQVTNVGSNPAPGTFYNGFYLSADQQFNGSEDPFVASKRSYVNLNPGESAFYDLTGPVRDLFPANYYGIGRTNLLGSIGEIDYQNNLLASDEQLKVNVRELELEVPAYAIFEDADWKYYKVEVGENFDLLVDFTSTRNLGNNEVYASYEKIPTPNSYDFKGLNKNSSDQRILIPETRAGFYYLLIKSDIPSNQHIEILARTLPFSILTSNPQTVGDGIVTTTVTGAGFRDGMEVSLVQNSVPVVSAQEVNLANSMNGTLLWNLTGIAYGTYDLQLKNPNGEIVVLENGLTIEASTGYSELTFDIQAPDVVRAGKTAFVTIVFKNEGNVDIPLMNTMVTVLEDIEIYEITTQGKLKINSTLDDLGRTAGMADYEASGGFKILPLYARDIHPDEELSVNIYGKL